MVSGKNKRKIVYEGTNYYWYVRVSGHGHRVYIISDDKKVRLDYPFLDTEIPVTSKHIRNHLKEYYTNISKGTFSPKGDNNRRRFSHNALTGI